MKLICEMRYGYSSYYLYYDSDTDSFYIKKYHCGGIDPGEEFCDGEYYISRSEAFEYLIRHGKLDKAAEFYNPEKDGEMITDLLRSEESHFFGFVKPELNADKNDTYYVFPDNDYVIYCKQTYFTLNNHGIPICDSASVKTILDNAANVSVHSYSYNYARWLSEPLIKKTTEIESREHLINVLREDIIGQFQRRSGKFARFISDQYELCEIQPDDKEYENIINRFQPKEAWAGGMRFWLDLSSRRLYAEVTTYPNALGAYRQDVLDLTPIQFYEIAQKCNFREELQVFKTQEDWDDLFNNTLKDAVSEAMARKQEAERKEKERLASVNAVGIPERSANLQPKLNIVSVHLDLDQLYGRSIIHVSMKDDSYLIEHQFQSKINSSTHFASLKVITLSLNSS